MALAATCKGRSKETSYKAGDIIQAKHDGGLVTVCMKSEKSIFSDTFVVQSKTFVLNSFFKIDFSLFIQLNRKKPINQTTQHLNEPRN